MPNNNKKTTKSEMTIKSLKESMISQILVNYKKPTITPENELKIKIYINNVRQNELKTNSPEKKVEEKGSKKVQKMMKCPIFLDISQKNVVEYSDLNFETEKIKYLENNQNHIDYSNIIKIESKV